MKPLFTKVKPKFRKVFTNRDLVSATRMTYLPHTREEQAKKMGMQIDKDLSTDEYTVLYDQHRALLAYRGIKRNTRDLSAAAQTALHYRKGQRYEEGRAVARAFKEKYKNHQTHLTGHSLGGALADEANKETGIDATIYNPGSGILMKEQPRGNVTVKRKAHDFVSQSYDRPVAPEYFFKRASRNFTDIDWSEAAGFLYTGLKDHKLDNFDEDE